MSGGILDDDEEDMFDAEETEENEISEDGPPVEQAAAQPSRGTHANRFGGQRPEQPSIATSRRLRVRTMKPKMAAKNPQITSILLTHNDGRQVMFVRGR